MSSLRASEPKDLLSCHLYINDPAMRLECELREMTGEGLDGEVPLDAVTLTAIDSMHYRGTDGTDEMLARFPSSWADKATISADACDNVSSSFGDGGASTPASTPLHVLDLGSGFGGCARYVATKLPRARVVALEIQPSISATAHKLTARCKDKSLSGPDGRVSHLCGDVLEMGPFASNLPAAWGSFDVVFSKLVVLHIPFAERLKLWTNLAAAGREGGLLYVEDYYAKNPLLEGEAKALVDVVGCPALPSAQAYVGQLEAAGFTDVQLVDVSQLWASFVSGRAQGYESNRPRHVRVHGEKTVASMSAFYKCTDALFAGGRLGGAIVSARFPAKKESA